MKISTFKKLIAVLLATTLLCSTAASVFAQESQTEPLENPALLYTDSGSQDPEVEEPPLDENQNKPEEETVPDVTEEDKLNPEVTQTEGEELDIEALLPQFEGDREALIEEMQELQRQVEEEKAAYLAQFSEEELREMEARMEETRAEFEAKAEEAMASYEMPYDPPSEAMTRAARSYSIASGSIAIQDGTNAGTIKISQGTSVVNNLNPKDTPITITGTSDENYVVVATSANRTVNMTISGLDMNNVNAATIASCISLTGNAVVNLTISGSNQIFAKRGGAGIEVPKNAQLFIEGDGELTVIGGDNSAGIGGFGGTSGDITINSGTIFASTYLERFGTIMGSSGAAIGGGYSGGCGTITINGGHIDADSVHGSYGAAIGNGGTGSGGDIIINGGIVVTRNGPIGSGYRQTIDSITINGGVVSVAMGIENSTTSAIGSYSGGNATQIKISDGTIHASALFGAAIGAGPEGKCDNILITGGNISAVSTYGAGIGGGDSRNGDFYRGVCENINISNATVIARSMSGAGIGSGTGSLNNDILSTSINITSGDIIAISSQGMAVGRGYVENSGSDTGTINIGKDANVVALSNDSDAISDNIGSGKILSFATTRTLNTETDKIKLLDSNANIVYMMDDSIPENTFYGSFALVIPTGNYSLYIKDIQQSGVKNNITTNIFSASQSINAYTNVTTDESPEKLYGLLGFAYPLPSEWTGYYTYYPGHAGRGMDLNAPQGTPIYSVDDGNVVLAGGSESDPRGFFVIITNDTPDPNNLRPLHTRYLHMWTNPDVHTGANVTKGQKIGEVGKLGEALNDNPVNHLHIDFNSSGYTITSIPESAGISTDLFYPYVNFHLDNTPKSMPSSEMDSHDLNVEDLFVKGHYYDAALIDMIGMDQYVEWRNSTLPEERNVYRLINDFVLTWDVLRSQLHSSIYEAYWNNRPQ